MNLYLTEVHNPLLLTSRENVYELIGTSMSVQVTAWCREPMLIPIYVAICHRQPLTSIAQNMFISSFRRGLHGCKV